MASPDMLCPNCPICGYEPQFVFNPEQAVCGTYDCRALFWNMTVTAAEQLADEHPVTLLRDDGPPP